MNVERGAAFEACYDSGVAGQVGIVSLMLIDNDGGIFWPADTTLIVETPAASGIYCANRTAPIIVGQYTLVWSIDGTYDPATVGIEDLFVLAVTTTLPPLVPSDQNGGPFVGPCSAWTTTEAVSECCPAAGVGSDLALLDSAVTSASQLLSQLVPQFKGICTRVVRPCGDPCRCSWNGGVWSWDGTVWIGNDCGPHCGCQPLSQVVLPNYPVTEIIGVLIDGIPLDPLEYRLDDWSRLTRKRDVDGDAQFWPACQNLDADSTEDGTFEVTYAFGQNPPQPGIDAATELACQVFLACPREGAVTGACLLPAGVTRITRQAVTIEKGAFTAWGYVAPSVARSGRAAGWQTGLPLVDVFLNAYNPFGLRRRPMAWTPDAQPYAYEVGTALGS